MGTTIAQLFSLGTFIVQIQSVQVDFACTKRLFNHLAEAIINVRNVGLCARCAIFLLKIKEIPFSFRLLEGSTFLKKAQNQFKMLLEMSIVLASIVPTKRMRISWWLCNNSEIPYVEMSRDNVQKRRESPYMGKSRDKDQKRYVYK